MDKSLKRFTSEKGKKQQDPVSHGPLDVFRFCS